MLQPHLMRKVKRNPTYEYAARQKPLILEGKP
jgi:hypothetical protein